jgi:hypothetical protein
MKILLMVYKIENDKQENMSRHTTILCKSVLKCIYVCLNTDVRNKWFLVH